MLVPFRWRMAFATLWNQLASVQLLRWFCGVRLDIRGTENIPAEQPFMVISNHQSEWETFYLARLFRPVCMVIKKELLSVPVFGWAMRAARHIPVDRSLRHASIDQIIKQGRQRLEDGCNLLIFPEATRVPPGQMKRYSRTAAKLAVEAGVPLLPVVHDAGYCWSNRGEMRPGTIHMIIGTAIQTRGRNADEVAAEAEQWSAENFNKLGSL
jgi:1-acyl-sn-glycerol-3-phosphate acyltransferase